MGLDHHNSKEVWDGRTWERVPLCENAARNTAVNFGRGIGVLQCYDNSQEYIAKVGYRNCLGEIPETDTLRVCHECLKELKKSARKNRYSLRAFKIRAEKRGY